MEELYEQSHIRIGKYHKEVRVKNIKQCLQQHATSMPDKEAVIFVTTDGRRQSVTWSQLYERSCSAARSMIQLGVQRKEIVAINLRTCPEWLYAAFGAIIAGAIPVSISFTYTDGRDLVAMMEKLKYCSLLVMDPGLDNVNWNIIRKLLDDYNAQGEVKSTKLMYLRYMIGVSFENCCEEVKDFQDLFQDDNYNIILPDIENDDTAIMLQTSGSTGVPKFVVHTHASLLSITGSDIAWVDAKYLLFNDRPFSWIGGFPLSVLTGQSRVTVSGFCPAPSNRSAFMKDIIEKERCTLLLALPPFLAELIRTQDKLPSDWPLIGIITGGQPLTKTLTECIGKVGNFLGCLYGSSEALFSTQALVSDGRTFSEFGCGFPLKISGLEMKVVDENDKTVPVNTRGEIYVRSPGLFTEYFNDPEKTKTAMTADGWYKTGDIAYMTEKGEFFVEGRKTNIIISGGMNVAPEHLEEVIKTAPGIESVVVVPVPDSVYYQVVCACVIKKAGSGVSEQDLRSYCESVHVDKPRLFTVLPSLYLFLEKFPETNTGKIDINELKSIALARFAKIVKTLLCEKY